MSTVDLGDGQHVPRNHLPPSLKNAYDQAASQLEVARAFIRSWVRPLIALQAPPHISGIISCTASGQTGRVYALAEAGGALLVDQRDVPAFVSMGFATVPTGAAPPDPRMGQVFWDFELSGFQRWDGAQWAPTTLA